MNPAPKRLQYSSMLIVPAIVLYQLAGARLGIDAREHAGIGSGIDYPIALRDCLEIARGTNVAVKYFHPACLQRRAIRFAARQDEIIESHDRERRISIQQRVSDAAAHESADSRDENFHTWRSRQEATISAIVSSSDFVISQFG